jgi:hypothetical protein
MKKKRFASYLLTGKAATLPFMINSSFADVVPSYTQVLSANVSLIEMPATGVRLNTIAASSTYGGADAAICSTSVPQTMNIVITGAKPGDTVYLAASSNKDDGSLTGLSPKLRIGQQDFTIITSFSLNKSAIQEKAGNFSKSISPISIPVDLNKLQQSNLFNNGIFYFQAVIFSTGDSSTMWASARVSELDQISVSSTGCPSTYGGSAYSTPFS